MPYKVYVSASTQNNNIGVGNYRTEQDEMMILADRVKCFLDLQKQFEVYRNKKGWTTEQTVKDCKSKKCDLFVDNHTNAGSPKAEGTETFYHKDGSNGSKKFSDILYAEVAPLSPGSDRGSRSDLELYKNGLYVLRNVDCPGSLIEHIFHTNLEEVNHLLSNMDKYAIAEAQAICKYFSVKFDYNAVLIKILEDSGVLNSSELWTNVFNGKVKANKLYSEILLMNILKIMNVDMVDLYVQQLYMDKIINSPDYWVNVFKGDVNAIPDYSEKLLNNIILAIE